MKMKAPLAVLPFALIAGMALAADPPKTGGHQDATDHGKMDMSGHGHNKRASEAFVVLDKNKDGKLTKAELAKDSPVRPHFDMLDSDKNGSLSQKEFAEYHAM